MEQFTKPCGNNSLTKGTHSQFGSPNMHADNINSGGFNSFILQNVATSWVQTLCFKLAFYTTWIHHLCKTYMSFGIIIIFFSFAQNKNWIGNKTQLDPLPCSGWFYICLLRLPNQHLCVEMTKSFPKFT